jgi:hypothetical protein
MNAKTHRRPLMVATAVLLAGVSASLAGNVQAIYLDNAAPGVGAVVSAVIWPVFLLASIELLIHTPWLANWRDNLTKLGVTMFVGAVAAYLSYFHLAHVLSAYGYDTVSRYAGPLAIDSAMAMATLALNRIGQARRVQADTVTEPVTVQLPSYDSPVLARHENEVSVVNDAGLWERLEAEMASETTPAHPIEVNPVSPAPSSNAVKPESVPADAADLIMHWDRADRDNRPAPGEVDKLVAAAHGVTPRTARRWRDALLPKTTA